jgi:hypothetical protein
LAPDNGAITDTLGWLLLAADDPTALPLLERAAEQAPEIPEIRYHLAAALVQHGNTGRAREILDSILRSGADFSSRGEAEALRSDLARSER